ncbi:proto-oncogene tyrosine-protein kinase ROS isoform X1 [Euwallacea fornicatus]|uniref:proto-oncogene tyrosine-protein kinase ROS isoform X1 n=1 Tax=Euwallacea fornicatus TaxID=995702 RepID=UPI00339034AA
MTVETYFLVISLVISSTSGVIDYATVEREVEAQCVQHCPLQNRTDSGRLDYTCEYDCNIVQCNKGCSVWMVALSSSCQRACNGTSDRLSQRELYCVIGCNEAIGKYFGQIRTLVGIPSAPALVDNSLKATSLKLEWRFLDASKARLTFHPQWKYEEIAASWQYCRNASWDPYANHFHIQGLQPYTKYRFRVALSLGHQSHGDEPIYSDQSVVIATLAEGIPASPPANVRVALVDAHSVSVTWEPGPFPHGPLLSYVLKITELGASGGQIMARTEVKDVSSTNTYHVVRNLHPNRNYSISVQMRNNNGAGPASSVKVTTPKEPQISENQQPILILGTQHAIFELESLFGDSLHLFHSDNTTIEGIGIHISKKLLFLSDANGYVWRIPIEQETQNYSAVLTPDQLDFAPLDISVDWINNQLYILGEMKIRKKPKMYLIKRCFLDGSSLTVAYAGLIKRPIAMEIDPCNGYLFWAIRDYSDLGGIYRLDLSDISNGIKHEKTAAKILSATDVGAFIVDYPNFRLFVPDQKKNTILAVSVDGNNVKDIRENVVKPKLENVLSLGTANQKFYWTDGSTVYNEEYHKGLNEYFHNKISHLGKTQYKKILINLNSTQPWPKPLNPPTNLQAIFGTTIAKAKWLPPHLFALQGKGSFQNWSYELSIQDLSSNVTTTYKTNYPSFSFRNLVPNIEYLMKVLAYTKSGKGTWSTEFKGSTLSQTKKTAIIWSGTEGLFKSDVAMESIETLIHKSRMRNIGFTGMTWYRDQIYMVTNSSQLYWYNLTSRKQGRLTDVDSVGSIAVDWIGKKLYWSNLKQQLIIRSNLNGSRQEPLPILTLAKEIRIDSVNGYLYWAREYNVECAHLNGDDKTDYDHLEPFSGKQVMGITLDFDAYQVYWIIRGSDGSHLFRAPMQRADSEPNRNFSNVKVTLPPRPNMQGPLSYFSNRLLWLQDERNAVVSDMEGKYLATISGKSIAGLNLVYVVDEGTQVLVNSTNGRLPNVTPECVKNESVKAIGSSDSFSIMWEAVKNVNYGSVFYEVQFDGLPAHNSTVITREPSVKYWKKVSPYSRLNVTIRAYTYWASSSQIRAVIHSPPSTPSVPTSTRTYVMYDHNNSLQGDSHFSISFRWNAPLYPNGILNGYKSRCWYMENGTEVDLDRDVEIPANETEYVISELTEPRVYFFEIQAYTKMGTGTLSAPIFVNSSRENPIPIMLLASSDSIYLKDVDNGRSSVLISNINTPLKLAYLLRENKLFWINEMQELLMYHLNSSNKTKLADLKGKPKGLALDWLERSLYYVEGINETAGSVIRKLNLNYFLSERKLVAFKEEEIYITKNDVQNIEVSPYSRRIYWLENVEDLGFKMMQRSTNGGDVSFFEVSQCNCDSPECFIKSFTLDHTIISNYQPTFILSLSTGDKRVFDGVNCDQVLESNSIYFSSYLDENSKINDMKTYGKHIQPYPGTECLSPKQTPSYHPTVTKKSYDYLTLKMSPVEFQKNCPNTSVPTTIFSLKYYEELREGATRKFLNTFEESLKLTDLKPFTTYVIEAAVSNYFSKKKDIIFGEKLVVRTSPGAPSKPRDISASVLHPTLALVNWLPPEQLNGEIVHYEIHWLTEGSLTGVRQKGEQSVSDVKTIDHDSQTLTTLLPKLSPNETYTVWIRAYSETNETSSDSDRVQITTYPEPAVFELVNKTSQTLYLSWEITSHIQEYKVEYAPITSTNKWKPVAAGEERDSFVAIVAENLKPKTQYKFRLSLLYEQYPEWYVWPSDSRFTFETLGDRPSPPSAPGIQFFSANVYKVVWEAPQDNGAPIELYSLDCLAIRFYRNRRSAENRTAWSYSAPSIEEETFEWEQVYNGTDNSWIITDLNSEHKYSFRVSALNSYGWSEPSQESTEFDISEAERLSQKNPMNLIFIATLLPISICIIIVICFGYVSYSRRCRKQKKVDEVVTIQRGPDVELATLRELPRRGVHSTNILYVSSAINGDDITMLPHIRRDQITLTKFLGSGAFGEVFEGKAKGLSVGAVAVKTLKKGASEQEKTEFLQEAQLMSHFKHEHILQLLGVCLDNDPQFIIMELMEGGDLLTYLRDSRGGLNNKPALALIDLLKMCLDVTRGCRYLEEMHFVHRDLACRNCLVSSMEGENRIVKIGDFGLARDIYKNDYYRKEGEGLLPVRWMAPESLLDGVFTCQSDVWAFGVLLWEIMTLGQQPYQARSNLEVLHYVRGGGRLGKPTDCPDDLYSLMLKCWAFEADKRPTFKHCLEVLDRAHRDHLHQAITGAHSQYVSTVPDLFDGISNDAYFLDENQNSSGTSWRAENEEDMDREEIPFLTAGGAKEIPKYLELLYEPQHNSELENDGYEVPNDMMRQKELSISESQIDCDGGGSLKKRSYSNVQL